MMNRRSTIKYLTAGGVTSVLGGSYLWLSQDREHPGLALDGALDRLARLELNSTESAGSWEVARTFNHLAQSIEFSMAGFPVMKSRLFQSTAGKLAFSVFNARGRMTHGLDEEIPGEIIEADHSDPARARDRLLSSLEEFGSYKGQLMPHFAYGELDRKQYTIAHVMHINNHLEEFRSA